MAKLSIEKSIQLKLLVSLFIGLIFLAGCNGGGIGNNSIELVTLVDNGILTMSPSGSYPIVTSGNKTFFGYYTSQNNIEIRYYDNVKHVVSNPVILWRNWGYTSSGDVLGDDHANPSIIVLSYQLGENAIHNGKLVVAAAEHGAGQAGHGRLQVRRSVYPLSIGLWEPPIELRDTRATYARLVETADGTLYLFCRLSRVAPNSRATFYYWTSTDAGESWSLPQLLVDADEGTDDAVYITVSPSSRHDVLHVGVNRVDYDNPTEGVEVGYSYEHLAQGRRKYPWLPTVFTE